MQVLKLNCKKCGYEWFPRTEQPYKCPRCQSPLEPKRKEKVREAEAVQAPATPTRSPALTESSNNE